MCHLSTCVCVCVRARAGELMDSKFWSAYHCCKHLAPRLRDGAAVALVGGVLNRRPGLNCAPLAAANGALEGLTRALALEVDATRRRTRQEWNRHNPTQRSNRRRVLVPIQRSNDTRFWDRRRGPMALGFGTDAEVQSYDGARPTPFASHITRDASVRRSRERWRDRDGRFAYMCISSS